MTRQHLSVFGLAAVLCTLTGLIPSHADAEHLAGRKTLKGLQGVAVIVEKVPPEAEHDGLHGRTLQADVEARLRQANIRVLTLAQALASPGAPTLYVHIQAAALEPHAYAVMLRLELIQAVSLMRDAATIVPAATWHSSGIIGTIDATELRIVRQETQKQADEFINAYKAMNPRM